MLFRSDQVAELDRRLQRVLEEVESPEGPDEFEGESENGEGSAPIPAPPRERLTSEQRAQIEDLFTKAASDRSRAFELKQLLDQLDVFTTYEDRFLDLFRAREP